MIQTGRCARVVHAIPGRLRLRFDTAGPESAADALAAARETPGVQSIEAKPASRSAVVQYDPSETTESAVLAALTRAGIEIAATSAEPTRTADAWARDTPSKGSGTNGALWELLVGPPPKLDRRFAESLALSAASLLAARRVGLMLGGGTTLPAYFAIWFVLRRTTGLGRRR